MSRVVRSAGLLPYRFDDSLEVLVAHPGGPFWANRDEGAWSLVKGLVEPGEDERTAAAREFEEETGWNVSASEWIPLGKSRLKSRKVVIAWAVNQNFDPDELRPGTFELHGREYPEIDRVAWIKPDTARRKLNPAQVVFIDRLEEHLELNRDGDGKD